MLSLRLPRVTAAPTQLYARFADHLPPVHAAFESVAQRMSLVKTSIERVPLALWNKKRNRSKKKYTAISRSFHKMEELIQYYRLDIQGQIVSLAEAPGGFLQCMAEHQKPGATFHVMSLVADHDVDVPKLHPSIVKSNVTVHTGALGNGDITQMENIDSLLKVVKSPVHLLTADGGYNERDFNKKEQHHLRLIFSEFYTAVALRSDQVVIKLFDIHTLPTMQLITLACVLYDHVSICKPPGSRPTNSEKYLVLSRFSDSSMTGQVQNLFKSVLATQKHVQSLFDDEVPAEIMNLLHRLSETVLRSQSESIQEILDSIFVTSNTSAR